MEFALQVCGWLIGLPLEILIIAALLRGPYRRFPFVFAYTVVNFLSTVIEIPSSVEYYRTGDYSAARAMAFYYWIDEGILQLLVLAVVISLIYHATSARQGRRTVRAALIAGAILFAGISFLIHHDSRVPTGVWMTAWTRDLYFISTILDLALWAMLIAARQKDQRLLMLSGALGIQFTGEAIGESLRKLSIGSRAHSAVVTGNIVIMLTNLVAMYIWWQTFREHHATRPPGSAATFSAKK